MSNTLGDILVTNVSFGQDGLRIEFMEQRFQSEEGGVESALVLFGLDEESEQLVVDIQAALSDVVKDYFTARRNPPATLPNNRFQRNQDVEDEA